MKFFTTAVLAWAFHAVAYAEICEEEEDECTREFNTCTAEPDGCCEGFDCHGFTFFKRCQEPPVCLEEWYACNPNPGPNEEAIECCSGFVCTTSGNGVSECKRPGKRTVEIPGFNIEETPTEPPVPTKKFECEDPVIHEGHWWGDPHIHTFDGVDYDCQGVGEFTVIKTAETSRMIQGRFIRIPNMDMSYTGAVVVRDQGGADIPKVQLSIPQENEGESTTINRCNVQLFVDGAQVPLTRGTAYEDEHVTVTYENSWVNVRYSSGFTARITTRFWRECMLDTFLKVPTCEGDELEGLLGNADGKPMNDWADPNGNPVTMPTSALSRHKREGYDYCVQWCVNDPADSMFHYNEVGNDFGFYNRCALEYGTSLVEFIDDLPEDVVQKCAGNLGCMIDAVGAGHEGLEGAIRAVALDRLTEQEDTVNQFCEEDVDCSIIGSCCDGFHCLKYSATDWRCKKGISSLTELKPQCNPVLGGYCKQVTCCGDMECVETNGGTYTCQEAPECLKATVKCHQDSECCDDMECVDIVQGKNGPMKTCRALPKPFSLENQVCFPGQECGPDLECSNGFCQKKRPLKYGETCWRSDFTELKQCEQNLACMPWKSDGRRVCYNPGLVGGKLKCGVICPFDGSIKCMDGLSCTKLSDHNYRKLVQNIGEASAKLWGMCENPQTHEIRRTSQATGRGRGRGRGRGH